MAEMVGQRFFIVMNDLSGCWVFDNFSVQIFVFVDDTLFGHPLAIGLSQVITGEYIDAWILLGRHVHVLCLCPETVVNLKPDVLNDVQAD